MQYPVAEWQELQLAPELTDLTFFGFCDALEVQDGANAPEGGWGVNHALPAWGSWWQNEYYPSCKLFYKLDVLANLIHPHRLACGDLSAESVISSAFSIQYLMLGDFVETASAPTMPLRRDTLTSPSTTRNVPGTGLCKPVIVCPVECTMT